MMQDTRTIIPYSKLKEYAIDFSLTHLNRLMEQERFPKAVPMSLHGRRKGWYLDDIVTYVEARAARREAALSGHQRS